MIDAYWLPALISTPRRIGGPADSAHSTLRRRSRNCSGAGRDGNDHRRRSISRMLDDVNLVGEGLTRVAGSGRNGQTPLPSVHGRSARVAGHGTDIVTIDVDAVYAPAMSVREQADVAGNWPSRMLERISSWPRQSAISRWFEPRSIAAIRHDRMSDQPHPAIRARRHSLHLWTLGGNKSPRQHRA